MARVAAVEATSLARTPLYERHLALGARLVPFAGYEMPVQYAGVIEEHRAVRTDAGAFDVSHMGEIHVDGPTAQAFLQEMLSNDLDRLSDGEAQYTLLTNEQGGIVDDLIAYRMAHGQYYLVVNASNRAPVYAWLKEREPRGTEVREASDEYGLVAVQGPRSLERLGLDEQPAFTFEMGELDGVEVMISRTGYTGELGVELCCAEDETPALWDAVLARGVAPCGLGARDTLRLEVCYPLHGNDINQNTDAISAGLGWACRLDTEFTGVEALRRIKAEGPARKLVPFVMEDKAVPRQGMPIEDGGEVTSGTHSPMLDRGIGMGYVQAGQAAPDTELTIDVRGKPRKARTVKKPIYRKDE
jgi:aminomethyltransferase